MCSDCIGRSAPNVARTVEGLARYPVNVCYPRRFATASMSCAIFSSNPRRTEFAWYGGGRPRDQRAAQQRQRGRPTSYVYVDVRGRDLTSVVGICRRQWCRGRSARRVSLSYAGQFEYLTRAYERLQCVPATLAIIFLLLYLIFRRFDEALLIMGTLPFALTGGFWLLYLMGYNQSVATAVGFIALAGVSAEFGVVMLIYLKAALERREGDLDAEEVSAAIREGALLRVRPKAMTVAVILAGLFPILIGTGAGSEVMSRIAAPMIGGMITAPLLSMFVLPAAFLMMRRPRAKRSKPLEGEEECVLQPS